MVDCTVSAPRRFCAGLGGDTRNGVADMKPTDVLRRLYDAFAAGNADALGLLIGETDWVEASGGPYGGRYRGLTEVAANVFGPIARDVRNFSAVPDEVVQVGDNRALALGFYRGTTPSGPLEIRFAHLATVEAGRITHFEQFTDTHEWHRAVSNEARV
jgi:ketosteroid isomerase-like protein